MDLQRLDDERMRQALELAHEAIGLSDPNPRVGCVIGDAQGRVFGTGFTQQVGGAHAEVMALRAAREAQCDLRGATAWVTLEPCAHHGRTPPCCDALIEAGLGRVVVGAIDPYPAVAGAGIARLQAAGVTVDMASNEFVVASRELNIGFFSRVIRNRPWVRLKVAVTLDGRMALPNGVSQWITGPEARRDVHLWRKRASALLTGVGTVIADNPRLDVREIPIANQPTRVIVDTDARTPLQARIFEPPGSVLWVTGEAVSRNGHWPAGVECLVLQKCTDGHIDLHTLIAELYRRGTNELHVEAGPTLNGALIRQHLIDELLVYISPQLVGPGRALAELPTLECLDLDPEFGFFAWAPVGGDLRLVLRSRQSWPF